MSQRTIAERLSDPKLLEKAMQKAVQQALKWHKLAGNPVVVWRNGEHVWIPAEEIPLPEEVENSPPLGPPPDRLNG